MRKIPVAIGVTDIAAPVADDTAGGG